VRELDRIAVYGRMEGIAIFELIGIAEDGPAPDWAKLYETALREYRERNFARAEDLFAKVCELHADDAAASLMIERCRRFRREAPPADWAGTTALDMK
jgi:adenylate cyclase